MDLLIKIKQIAADNDLKVQDKGKKIILSKILAERKVLLSKKRLTYKAQIKLKENKKEVHFAEKLVETGIGLSMGSGSDGDIGSGYGFKTETVDTRELMRKGIIEEQSNLLGKKYEYSFNYAEIREQIIKLTEEAGYEFKYHISGLLL